MKFVITQDCPAIYKIAYVLNKEIVPIFFVRKTESIVNENAFNVVEVNNGITKFTNQHLDTRVIILEEDDILVLITKYEYLELSFSPYDEFISSKEIFSCKHLYIDIIKEV